MSIKDIRTHEAGVRISKEKIARLAEGIDAIQEFAAIINAPDKSNAMVEVQTLVDSCSIEVIQELIMDLEIVLGLTVRMKQVMELNEMKRKLAKQPKIILTGEG